MLEYDLLFSMMYLENILAPKLRGEFSFIKVSKFVRSSYAAPGYYNILKRCQEISGKFCRNKFQNKENGEKIPLKPNMKTVTLTVLLSLVPTARGLTSRI